MNRIRLDVSWMTCVLMTLLVPVESVALGFSSTTTNVDITQTAKRMADCGQFKLKEVQGGPADTAHTYWFNGVCKIWVVKFVGGKEQGSSGGASLWAEAKATWNAQSNTLEERVKLTDPGNKHSGGLELSFKCVQNPIVQKANCVRLKFTNLTDWTGFEVPLDKNRPLLTGQTTQAEVAGLTKTAVPSPKRNVSAAVSPTPASASNPVAAPLQVPAGAIGGPAPRSASKMAGQPSRAANATRQNSTLPAVQVPAPTTGMAGTPARAAPNWSGLGGQAADAAVPVAANTSAATASVGILKGATASVSRELAAASCTAGAGGLRFSCATRVGFDRCEALRREQKVGQCALNERR